MRARSKTEARQFSLSYLLRAWLFVGQAHAVSENNACLAIVPGIRHGIATHWLSPFWAIWKTTESFIGARP